ncbi:MAG TPA: ComEC/Rec2 family competence protein [Candidatus Omnitrophota bacterium]|nr:ComEC/Rec2 family competence protein [Candidatus Omnitrophota bacterium]
MKNPFAWIALYFSLGIVCARQFPVPFYYAWCIAAACCVMSAIAMRMTEKAPAVFFSRFFLSCALFFCGAACMVNANTCPADHIRHLVFKAMGGPCVVRGRVGGETGTAGSRTVFDLKTDRVIINSYSYGCSGVIRVVTDGAVFLEHGTCVEATGMLGLPSRFRSSGRTSIRDRLRDRGIYAVLKVRSVHRIRILAPDNRPGMVAVCLRVKQRAQDIVDRYMPPPAAGIMNAMLLGDKAGVPRVIYNDMIRSGTVHILVVSGFNVGVIAGACALVLKIMRIARYARLIIIVPVLILYCLMTGASPPVVRATIMGIFLFLSWYVRRDPSISQALSLSAFSILAFDPRQLFNASFQLSFAAVAAVGLLSPVVAGLLKTSRIPFRPLRWTAQLSVVSLSAWLGTAGFIAYYFRIIAPVTVLANIFIPVIASLITLCGAGLIVSSFLCPYIAYSFASMSEFLILSLLRLNSLLIRIPWAYWRFP